MGTSVGIRGVPNCERCDNPTFAEAKGNSLACDCHRGAEVSGYNTEFVLRRVDNT